MGLFLIALIIILGFLLFYRTTSRVAKETDNPILSLVYQNILDIAKKYHVSCHRVKHEQQRQSLEIAEQDNILYITTQITSSYPYTLTHYLEYHIASRINTMLLNELLPCLNITPFTHDFLEQFMGQEENMMMVDEHTKVSYYHHAHERRLMMTYQSSLSVER